MPLMLIIFSFPSLIYLAVRKIRGDQVQIFFKDLGWQTGRPLYYLWGLGVLIVLGLFSLTGVIILLLDRNYFFSKSKERYKTQRA